MLSVVFLFFFFKQKTAYEMRISDWSSDVCSSDLGIAAAERYSHGRVSVDVAPAFLLNDRAGRYVRAKTDCIGLRKFRAARLGGHFKCVFRGTAAARVDLQFISDLRRLELFWLEKIAVRTKNAVQADPVTDTATPFLLPPGGKEL